MNTPDPSTPAAALDTYERFEHDIDGNPLICTYVKGEPYFCIAARPAPGPAPVRPNVVNLSAPVTLMGGKNDYLPFPCEGVVVTAEFGTDDSILWAAFRSKRQDGSYGCPVHVGRPLFTSPVARPA